MAASTQEAVSQRLDFEVEQLEIITGVDRSQWTSRKAEEVYDAYPLIQSLFLLADYEQVVRYAQANMKRQ